MIWKKAMSHRRARHLRGCVLTLGKLAHCVNKSTLKQRKKNQFRRYRGAKQNSFRPYLTQSRKEQAN